MWPYLRTLNPQAEESHFGYIVTFYSVSQCISAFTFGYWSNRIEQVRFPLLTGFFLMMVGNVLYLSLPFYATSSVTIAMLIARFVLGCGTGNICLLRAYVSTSSSKSDRARAIACINGGLAAGSLIGPALQLLFSPLGHQGISILPFFNLNIYNSPALFSLFLDTAGFLAVLFAFEEKYDVLKADAAKTEKLPEPCKVAILVCFGTRSAQISVMATIETLGSAFSMLMFTFNNEQAVAANATAHLVSGIAGAILYLALIVFNLSKW
ncbi:unnamed protein product [Strongylus vulgaris]|uniref:Major facilitator superfamily (MFS) profile domain-containing protein n=1 Tax=Strongylus vulgaris TaxID=40348 RepID=A0A3P7LHI5_STRVU|nr:unnamed protein product [Strongylus vulgaris]